MATGNVEGSRILRRARESADVARLLLSPLRNPSRRNYASGHNLEEGSPMMTTTIRTMLGATMLALSATTAFAAPPAESTAVWRAQLTLGVCDVSYAGTDDHVKVRLNGTNMTAIGRPIVNDFQRGSIDAYDLISFTQSTGAALRVSDIQKLELLKDGTDALKVCRVTLVINERTIYHKTWASPGFLMENSATGHYNTLYIAGTTLRASSYWQNYGVSKLPSSIPATSTQSRMEAAYTTGMYGRDMHWNGRVKVSRRDSTAVRVSVPFVVERDYWPDQSVSESFDLRYSCSAGVVKATVQNFTITTGSASLWYWLKVLLSPLGVSNGGLYLLFGYVDGAIVPTILPDNFTFQMGVCPSILVSSYGDVQFGQ
jgi:hypothetical protein